MILLHHDDHFTALAFIRHAVRLGGLVERKAMGNNHFGFELPLHKLFNQVFHVLGAGDPRTVDRDLVVDNRLAHVERDCIAFAHHNRAAPTARAL